MKKTNISVSVIVPIYNSERYLPYCLKSIINQSYTDLEIILIDDGSTDDSYKICEQFKKIDSRISLLKHENHGVGYTRNMGLNNANGKYVMFIDSDDIIEKDMISSLVNKIEVDKSDLAICGIVTFYEVNKEKKYINTINRIDSNEKCLPIKDVLEYLIVHKTDVYFGSPDNKIYKKEIIEKNQIRFCQDYDFAEDFLFNVNYFNHISNVSIIDDNFYYYRRDNNMSITKKGRDTLVYWDHFKKIFYKYSYLLKDNDFSEVDINSFIVMALNSSIWNSFLQYPNIISKERNQAIWKIFSDVNKLNLKVNLSKLSNEEIIIYHLIALRKVKLLRFIFGLKFRTYKFVKYIKRKGGAL